MGDLTFTEILQAVNAGGVSVVLLVIVWMFLRGEILPRKVYEKMSEQLIERVVGEIVTRIIVSVEQMLSEWRERSGEMDRSGKKRQ